MENKAEQHFPKVRVLNWVVFVISLVAIACYFFAPFWSLEVKYTVTAEILEEMLRESEGEIDLELDYDELIGEDGIPVSVSVSIHSTELYQSFFSDGEQVFNAIIERNVNSVVNATFARLTDIVKDVAKSITRGTVVEQVTQAVWDSIASELDPGVTWEEIEQKLDDLGLTYDYFGEKAGEILEELFQEGGTDVDSMTETVMDIVDEVLQNMRESAEGREGYEFFAEMELSEENRESIEESIRDLLQMVAKEDGTIDPNDLIVQLLEQAINGADGEEASGISTLAATLADESAETEDPIERLKTVLMDAIDKNIPEGTADIVIWVFRGMGILMLFSSLTWLYVIIKIIVKAARKGKPFNSKKPVNPTVKLGLPIWLGWLPYLLLAGIPSLALLFGKGFAMALLSEELAPMLANLTISISSIGWVAALCAAVCFGISIYFMVVRRKIKKEEKEKKKQPKVVVTTAPTPPPTEE